MYFLTVFCFLSALSRIRSSTVSSPQIRILDVATKASETRLIPHLAEYRNSFEPYLQQRNTRPLESYVIYDQYPFKIFKKWKASPPADFPGPVPQNYLEFNRRPGAEFPPDYYFQNRQEVLPPPKPTLAYRSVYSNVIKVFDNSLEGIDRSRFPGERYMKPFEGGIWKPPIEYELLHPQDVPQRQLYHSLKLPENFPKVFSPNEKFHFPSFEEEVAGPPKFFYPQGGYYDTHTINYNKENVRHRDEVEVLPEKAFGVRKNQKKTFLCSFIRVNQRQFPEGGNPCGRSDDDLPLVPPEYPDYSNLPNDKIPVEHRRQHIQIKRIKRSELNESYETRQKRNAGFGYSSWSSPFGYESGYEGYFGDNYQRSRSRYRNQGSRNKYSSGSRYDDYDDDYQNEDSNSKGLTGYLTNGGRRYKNRKNNNDEEDENEDENNNNNDNNRDEDSDEEMERMNSNRRDSNDRRNSDDRDRRRNNNNNNYNDEDDNRDNRRNNNRNSNRRYNNNNRRYNDRYDNNNRNRYYSNNNSNNNNGYGGSYGGYGSSYGGNGGYGSSYGGNGGYGSSYGGNGGYGSSYGSSYGGNGGYGYGGYGNGFGSF